MKPYIPFLLLTLSACAAPNVTTSPIEDDVDTEETEATESEGTTQDGDTSGSEESQDDSDTTNLPEDDTNSETPENDTETELPNDGTSYTLESNTWYVTNATMIEDNCAWDAPLRQFFGIGSDALLPESFTVEGFEDSFFIEANTYGAAGPIECIVIDGEFECETQSVAPLSFDLGSFGWTYAIDFTGVTTSETAIIGIAEVRFPTVSDWLVPIFQSMGMDHTQCVQSFELYIDAN